MMMCQRNQKDGDSTTKLDHCCFALYTALLIHAMEPNSCSYLLFDVLFDFIGTTFCFCFFHRRRRRSAVRNLPPGTTHQHHSHNINNQHTHRTHRHSGTHSTSTKPSRSKSKPTASHHYHTGLVYLNGI